MLAEKYMQTEPPTTRLFEVLAPKSSERLGARDERLGESSTHCPRGGSEDAFTKYVAPEMPLLARAAARMTVQKQDAEDLVQETLLHAYRAIGRFDGAYPRAWLLTIMHHVAASAARRRSPVLFDYPEHLEADAAQRALEATSAEDVVVRELLDGDLALCLASLSPQNRRVIELVDARGLRYAEAAAILGVPVGTVMSRLHRARACMRSCLREVDFPGALPVDRTDGSSRTRRVRTAVARASAAAKRGPRPKIGRAGRGVAIFPSAHVPPPVHCDNQLVTEPAPRAGNGGCSAA